MTVDALKGSSIEFAVVHALVMRIRSLLRGGDVEKLTIWLQDAQHSAFHDIRRFAQTLTLNLAGVGGSGKNLVSHAGAESQS